MPQMAPTMWLTLFITITLSIFIISSLLFFNNNNLKSTSLMKNLMKTSKTWTW